MKHRIIVSIALALSVVLISLMSSGSTAKAQQGGRLFVADTGMIKLGPNQVLRVAIFSGDDNFNSVAGGGTSIRVRFRRIGYTETCDGEVCKHTVSSQSTSAPVTIAPGEGASFILPYIEQENVRGMVSSNSPDVRVNALIINRITGDVISVRELALDD